MSRKSRVERVGADVRALSEGLRGLCVESRALRVAIEGLKRVRTEGQALRVASKGLRGLRASPQR